MAFIKRAVQRGIARRRLGSEKEIERVKGAMTLLEVGGRESNEKLLEGMNDESWNVRNACAMAVAQVYQKNPSKEIVELLHERLKEAELAEKLALIEALGKIGDDDSLPILLDILKKSKADLQYAVVIALAHWANLQLLPPLIAAGQTKDYLTRRAVMMTSYNIIVEAIPNTTLKELMKFFHWIVQIYVETGYLGPLILRFLEVPKEDIDKKLFPVPLNEYAFTLINELLEGEDFDPKKYEMLHEMAYPIMF